jgi:hypothetical protein
MIMIKALRYTSSILSLFGGLLILKNKKLQAHPFKAFAILMIVDSGNFLQFDLNQDIWRSDELIDFPNVPLLGYSFGWSKDKIIEKTYDILAILYCSNDITVRLFSYTFYSLNFGLTWDLLNSFRNPFDSTESRYKAILLMSPTIFILFLVYWGVHEILNIKTIGQTPVCGEFRFGLMLAPGDIVVRISFCIYALYAIYHSGKGLLRKGLNKEIK